MRELFRAYAVVAVTIYVTLVALALLHSYAHSMHHTEWYDMVVWEDYAPVTRWAVKVGLMVLIASAPTVWVFRKILIPMCLPTMYPVSIVRVATEMATLTAVLFVAVTGPGVVLGDLFRTWSCFSIHDLGHAAGLGFWFIVLLGVTSYSFRALCKSVLGPLFLSSHDNGYRQFIGWLTVPFVTIALYGCLEFACKEVFLTPIVDEMTRVNLDGIPVTTYGISDWDSTRDFKDVTALACVVACSPLIAWYGKKILVPALIGSGTTCSDSGHSIACGLTHPAKALEAKRRLIR